MGLVIAPAQKVHVICRDETDAEVSRDLRQHAVAPALLLHSVVVQFDKKVLRPEYVAILAGALFRLLNVVCLNRAVDFACQTTA